MASSFGITLVLCCAFLAPVSLAGATSRGVFINPAAGFDNMLSVSDPAQQYVYLVGSQTPITWLTTFESYSCNIWQQNVTQFSATASPADIRNKSSGSPELGGWTWIVSAEGFDINQSPLFYLTCDSNDEGNGSKLQGFHSFFFNLTNDPNDHRLNISNAAINRALAVNNLLLSNASIPTPEAAMELTSSANSTAAPAQQNQTQPANTQSETQSSTGEKVGLGVGIGIGIPVLAALAFLIFRTYRSKNERLDNNVPAAQAEKTMQHYATYDHYSQAQPIGQIDSRELPAEMDASRFK